MMIYRFYNPPLAGTVVTESISIAILSEVSPSSQFISMQPHSLPDAPTDVVARAVSAHQERGQ
jgi:hypothetical protein